MPKDTHNPECPCPPDCSHDCCRRFCHTPTQVEGKCKKCDKAEGHTDEHWYFDHLPTQVEEQRLEHFKKTGAWIAPEPTQVPDGGKKLEVEHTLLCEKRKGQISPCTCPKFKLLITESDTARGDISVESIMRKHDNCIPQQCPDMTVEMMMLFRTFITAAVRQREDEWRTQIEESVEKCSDCSAKVKKGILEHLEHN